MELRELNDQYTARKNYNFLENIYDILRYKNKVDLNISAYRGVLLNIFIQMYFNNQSYNDHINPKKNFKIFQELHGFKNKYEFEI